MLVPAGNSGSHSECVIKVGKKSAYFFQRGLKSHPLGQSARAVPGASRGFQAWGDYNTTCTMNNMSMITYDYLCT